MAHLADGSVVDQLLRELHRGNLAVVVVDDRDGAGLAGRLQHLARLGEIVRQRFLADDVLARRERGQDDILVGIARGRDIDELDIGSLDQRVVVGLVPLPTERLGRLLHAGLVPPADGDHPRSGIDVEEMRDLPVRIRMRPSHELVAYEANADVGHGVLLSVASRGVEESRTGQTPRSDSGRSLTFQTPDESAKQPTDLLCVCQQEIWTSPPISPVSPATKRRVSNSQSEPWAMDSRCFISAVPDEPAPQRCSQELRRPLVATGS